MKRSPLYEIHRQLGGVFTVEAGWEVVAHYGDARTGALAIREGAGVSDLTHRGWLRVAGRDRVRFLQAMFTNDVAACAPGQGTWGAFLNDKGRVVSDATVLVLEEEIFLDVEAQAAEKLPPVLDRYVIMDDVTISDETATRVLLSVQGPTASDVVAKALCAEVGGLGDLEHRVVGGARVVRCDRVGETGFDLHLAPAAAEGVLDALQQAGTLPVGSDALELLRVEVGLPRAFVDMDETTLFLEVAGERGISRSKGCYLGQEVVVRAQDRGGVKRQLRGLRVKGIEVPVRGAKVRIADREVGHVTSVAFSPTLGVPIALAILHKDAWEPGTEVSVEGMTATVDALPFRR